jgi:hypothetical protein
MASSAAVRHCSRATLLGSVLRQCTEAACSCGVLCGFRYQRASSTGSVLMTLLRSRSVSYVVSVCAPTVFIDDISKASRTRAPQGALPHRRHARQGLGGAALRGRSSRNGIKARSRRATASRRSCGTRPRLPYECGGLERRHCSLATRVQSR